MSSHPEKINGVFSPQIKTEDLVFRASDKFKDEAHFTSFNQYKNVYDFSISDKERFWSAEARELYWFNLWKEVKTGNGFNSRWFEDGKTNLSYNCLDRHLPTEKRNKAAIIWESESGESRILTYQLLYTQVCKFANLLKKSGVKQGDYVIIYMGVIPEAVVAMLACSRIGAIHSVVYSELSSNSLSIRINDLQCRFLITQDFIQKKGNQVNIKSKVDSALENSPSIEKVIVYLRAKDPAVKINPEKEIIWQEEIEKVSDDCEALPVLSQHPLFSMFINGSNGELINIQHLTGGYMVQTYLTSKWIFDIKGNDIIWSASDVGWISGHSYGVYGPLLNGITTFLYEGVPIYPEPDKYWQLISKYRINILYINPTTVRALMKLGSDWVFKHDLSSLRLLAVKGETIKTDTWFWLYENIGKGRCPVVNTWLQSETGAIIISPFPGASEIKPGYTSCPFPGIEIDIVDIEGKPVNEREAGFLIIKDTWPSMFSLGNNEKSSYNLNCWKHFEGNYFTGDAAVKDEHGYIKILGRVDDVIKAAGNRVGGSEIEKVLLSHPTIKEAAVVKRADEIIENAIIAFVVLNNPPGTLLLKEELRNYVSEKIGSIAKPDELIFLDSIPKLENNKIDRKTLRLKAREGLKELSGEEAPLHSMLEKLRDDYQKNFHR